MAKNAATTVRLPEPVLNALRAQADRNHRHLSGELLALLEKHLDPVTDNGQGRHVFDYSFAGQGGRV